jgi:hypothetical protein
LNARNDVRLVPSLAVIVMFENVPTFDVLGVPASAPVVALNDAQLGRLVIDQVSARPSGSEPLGRKLYALPAVIELAGVPLTTGARLLPLPPLLPPPVVPFGTTRMANAGRAAVPVLLLTEMTMFEYVPVRVPVGPCNSPVVVENVAHVGLLTME